MPIEPYTRAHGPVVSVGMARAGGVATVAPAASAAPACQVVDRNSGQSYTGLQAAVDAAAAGHQLVVTGDLHQQDVSRQEPDHHGARQLPQHADRVVDPADAWVALAVGLHH